MEPQFRFCSSADGTRVAYAVYGSGPPLLFVRAYTSSMHTLFAAPETRAHLDAFATRTTLVTFDRRGTGASARDVHDLSVESATADIATVADAVGVHAFTLLAEGSAILPGARYVIEHPDRVARLVLWPAAPADSRGRAQLLRGDWSIARRVVAGTVYPDGPVTLQRAYSARMKDAVSPEMASRYNEVFAAVDLDALLSAISVPTLVLQRQQDNFRQVAMWAAALVPNSQLQLVAGSAGSFFPEHEPVVEAIFDFMGLGEATVGRGGVTTVLFTDIVGHTEMMHRLGDAKGRDVLRHHERITRETLRQHGGVEVKTMGDGFMASFGSVTQGIECAIALQRAFAVHSKTAGEPLYVRVGLNAGEPIEEDGDLFGSTVILASRLAAQAEGGEILTSVAVRELCAGKTFQFTDRGETALRGFEDPVRVYEVHWRD